MKNRLMAVGGLLAKEVELRDVVLAIGLGCVALGLNAVLAGAGTAAVGCVLVYVALRKG